MTGAGELVGAVGRAVVALADGAGRSAPVVREVLDYWSGYHLAKAGLAALLALALIVPARSAWRRVLGAGTGAGRAAIVGASTRSIGLSAAALGATLLVIANVQGAVAPLTSALALPGTAVPASLRDDLVAGGPPSPALGTMLADYSGYHIALAVGLALLAVGTAFVGVRSVRSVRTGALGGRRVLVWLVGAGWFVVTLACVSVVVANIGNALGPAAGLQLLFDGG